MPWDDLHEPKEPGNKGGRNQGGPEDKTSF